MALYFSFLYILLFFIAYFIGYIKKIHIRYSSLLVSFVLLALSYAIIAYHIVPPSEWDLARHYSLLDRIRLEGVDYLLNKSLYRNQPGSIVLFYIVSMLPRNNYLPFISVLVGYLIIGYIACDTARIHQYGCREVFTAVLLHFALSEISWTLSNVRQPLSMAFAALAIYLDFEKKHKLLVGVLYVVSILIHPGTAAVVLIRVLYLFGKRIKFFPVVFAIWGLIPMTLSRLLAASGISFFSYIGNMLNTYFFSTRSEFSDGRPVFVKFVFVVLIVIALVVHKRASLNTDYYSFFLWLALFTLGGVESQQIFMRYALLLGYTCFPLINQISPKPKREETSVYDCMILFFFLGLIAYQFVAVSTHGVGIWN